MRGGRQICLCLTEGTLEADLRLVEKYRHAIDLLELRVDFLEDSEAALAFRFPGLVDLPVIVALRRTRDGGRFAADERERASLFGRLLEGGFAYADLEDDLEAPWLERKAALGGVRVIRSLHDFAGVPEGLARRISAMPRGPDEIPKAAVMPKSTGDLARLLEAFESLRGREKILLGMGDFGFATRVLASRLGSFLCYSSPSEGSAAPGHVDPGILEDIYRFHSIGEGTALFGVIGNPVMHSLSPVIHNRGFAALGLDAVYVPFLVDEIAPFWKVAEALSVRGFSVTVPHKRSVVSGLSARDALVDAVGACNTVIREDAGRRGWRGTNTDVEGFLAPLRAAFGGSVPEGIGATVIGAGGAARAVVYALVRAGARVLVLNRTRERARQLAVDFNIRHAGLDEEGLRLMREHSDLVVQATSAGGEASAPADPVMGYRFSGSEIAYELLYCPSPTPFLQKARDAGCRSIQGIQMLLAQAFEQFRHFTGSEFPMELRRDLEHSLE